jgi:hypothetical protein
MGRGCVRKDFYGIPEPDGLNKNRTGAIYKIPAGDAIPHQGTKDVPTQTYQAGQPEPGFDPGFPARGAPGRPSTGPPAESTER